MRTIFFLQSSCAIHIKKKTNRHVGEKWVYQITYGFDPGTTQGHILIDGYEITRAPTYNTAGKQVNVMNLKLFYYEN